MPEGAEAYLHAHGIRVDPVELEEMLVAAVSRLPRALYDPITENELSEHEADVLQRGGFDISPTSLGREDPVARGAAEFAAILVESLDTPGAAAMLGVKESRIRQRLGSNPPSLYGVKVNREWRIPRFQFDDDGLVRGFDRVVGALDPNLHPLAVHRWFTSESVDLVPDGGISDETNTRLSPKAWLRMGWDIDRVVSVAGQI